MAGASSRRLWLGGRGSPSPATCANRRGRTAEAFALLDQRRARRLQRRPRCRFRFSPPQDNGGYILAPSLDAGVSRRGATQRLHDAQGHRRRRIAVDRPLLRARAQGAVPARRRAAGPKPERAAGYLFEEGLHDLNLDKYAQPFRDRFPVVANKLTPSSDPSESVAASNVVDGLALRCAWDAGQLPVGGDWGPNLPAPGARSGRRSSACCRSLDDYADALGDLSISEAVFQIMRGNFGRAGTLAGRDLEGPAPARRPMSSTPRAAALDLTHRVVLLFAGNPVVNATWSGVSMRPRAAAEPWIDAWLSQLLPDPASRDLHCDLSTTQAAITSQAGFAARPGCAAAGCAGDG